MPNIMITYRCNLRCPYCFANEFVNKTYTDMTMDAFREAVQFAVQDGPTEIGLIGGEPTLHPQFAEMMEYLVSVPQVKSVMLYTNGLLLDRYTELFTRAEVISILKILVNCNSAADMGRQNAQKLQDNLDLLIYKYRLGRNVKLGINLPSNDFDYSFIKELLLRYDMYQIRMSLTVPDFKVSGHRDVIESFLSRKAYLLQFYKDMDEIGVLAYYDCNRPPRCIWTDEEWAWINWYRNRHPMIATNIADEDSKCSPVIDILPSLQAVRCFGLSEFAKTDIHDFASVSDLKRYYENRIDYAAYKITSCADCKNCYERGTKTCMGGCLGFKYSKIEKLNEQAERLCSEECCAGSLLPFEKKAI